MTTAAAPRQETHMTTTLTFTDPRVVEEAAAGEWLEEFGPLKLLNFAFHRPDGAVRVCWGWTAGGAALGDRIDLSARSRLNGADWLAALRRSEDGIHERGRNRVIVHDLPTIEGLIAAGTVPTPWGDDAAYRSALAEMTGGVMPSWQGVGPTLLRLPNRGRP